ncbi:hypothetical protein [Aporhodopirellula aestuarii]|uniref:Secreted protein n=1 Tax=Aporhodopirellula aestuarii TaxID=2950107 RepID=A0ABT0TYZ8_9BACT|nr:hypothetical protein [Aporhodopirellula aestuarii]MCM2369760.1 hypothetical protein [Aporhodopirellula aestuarii]
MPNFLVGSARFGILVTAVLAASLPLAAEDSPNTIKPQRPKFYDARPQEATGWVTIDKTTFWPLCYEALEQTETVRALIGSEDKEQLADELDKCAAWLNLAASAAMTRGEAGVVPIASECVYVADRIRSGKVNVEPAEIQQLMTLCLLGIAKSHLIRAEDVEQSSPVRDATPKSKNTNTAAVREAEKEIAEARYQANEAKYIYVTEQLRRHIFVSQTYLQAAVDDGGLQVEPKLLSDEFTAKPLTKDTSLDEAVELVDSLRTLHERLFDTVETQRRNLAKTLGISDDDIQ